MQLDNSNGLMFIKYGYHTLLDLFKDTLRLLLEFKEHDLFLKDYLNKYLQIKLRYSISYMLSLNKVMDCIHMLLRFMIGWFQQYLNNRNINAIIFILPK